MNDEETVSGGENKPINKDVGGMNSYVGSDTQPEKSISVLDKDKAIAIGIIGILLPVGIQDFVVRRFFWGSMHIVSLLLFPVGCFLWIFDGFCAGGKFCSQPPGIMSIIGSCMIGWALVLLVLNLLECIKLISSRMIMFSRKSFTLVMIAAMVITTVALFIYRLSMYYS